MNLPQFYDMLEPPSRIRKVGVYWYMRKGYGPTDPYGREIAERWEEVERRRGTTSSYGPLVKRVTVPLLRLSGVWILRADWND